MQLRTLFGVLLVLLAATVPATAAAQESNCSFPVERTDLTGTDVTVEEEPESVVTLNPSAAQTMWEMGAQDKVVGVTKHAMNLEGASEKTNISGGGETISNEEVVGLEPDLVLAPNTIDEETVSTLRGAGLTVFHFEEAKSIDDIYEKTRIIGELTGECEAAEETVGWMQSELETVDEAVEGQDRPGMIYTFYGYTAGNGTFIGNVIERAGAVNVAAEAGIESFQPINDEVIVEQDPDWILLNSDDDQVPANAAYNGTTAVQEDQIVVVDNNQLNRPAPRVVYPLVEITKALHPEAYAAANETAAENESTATDGTESPATTDSPTATATGTADEPEQATTSESGPGFTAAGAIVALACVALLGGRRSI